MAIPIMATPTLEGEDTMRFYRELDENEEKRVPAEEVRRGADLFDAKMKKNPKIGVSSGYA